MAFFQILFFFQKCARQFDNFHSLDGGIFIGILGSQKYHHTPYGLSGEHKKVSGNGTMAGVRSSKRVRRGTSAFDLCPLFLAISRQKKRSGKQSLERFARGKMLRHAVGRRRSEGGGSFHMASDGWQRLRGDVMVNKTSTCLIAGEFRVE